MMPPSNAVHILYQSSGILEAAGQVRRSASSRRRRRRIAPEKCGIDTPCKGQKEPKGDHCPHPRPFRGKAGQSARSNTLNVDNYHFISADNPGPGVWDTAGVARTVGYQGWSVMGSVCIPIKKYRVGISEFWGDPNKWESGKLNAALVNIK